MIDLAQVSLALRNSTSRSLILLDEFGKGTLSTGSLIPLPRSLLCLLCSFRAQPCSLLLFFSSNDVTILDCLNQSC
jgi:hypothetical protein